MLLWLGFAHKQVVIGYTPSMNAFISPISLLGFPDVFLDTRVEIPSNSEGISGTGQGPLNMLEWKGNCSWSVEVGEMNVVDFQSLSDLCGLHSPSLYHSTISYPCLMPTFSTLPQWNTGPSSFSPVWSSS